MENSYLSNTCQAKKIEISRKIDAGEENWCKIDFFGMQKMSC